MTKPRSAETMVEQRKGHAAFDLARRLAWSAPAHHAFVAACAAVVVALAATYFFLAEPAADDFCRATIADADQFAGWIYNGWSGRWLIMWGHGLVMPRLDLDGIGYSLVLLALAGAWYLGFLLAAELIVGRATRRRDRMALALLLLVIFWSGAPSQAQAFYWLTGAAEYALPFMLMMAALRLVGGLGEARRIWLDATAAGVLGVLVGGINELGAMPLVGAMACFAAGAFWLGRRRVAVASAFAFVIATAGLVANLAAPGTLRRLAFQERWGEVGGGLDALRITLMPYDAPPAWLADPRMLALSLVLLAMPRFRQARPEWTQLPIAWLLVLPVVTLGGIMLEYGIAAYALGHTPFARVQNLLYALLLVGWTATLFAIPARLRLGGAEGDAGKTARAAAVGLLGVSILTAPNTAAALRDLPAALGPWREGHEAREQSIRSQIAAGRGEILLARIAVLPAPLMDPQVSPDPAYFTNRCLADYRRVERVRLLVPSPVPGS